MSYVAVNYVGKWSPGEIIGEALTDEQAGRLLRKGRIKLLVTLEEKPAPEPEPEPAAEATPAEEAAEEPETEETVDAEPLEIDAADALVTAPKPKKTTKARAKK